MKRQHVSPYGIVAATLLAFIATAGTFLAPKHNDGLWLSIFAASFIVLFFSLNVPEVQQDENP